MAADHADLADVACGTGAEELPFADESLDVVICQFGLMFFDDRDQALREMLRVLRSGGRLAVAVWDSLDHTPG